MGGTVRVGLANEGELDIDLDIVEKWEPTNVNYIGETVFFKADNSYFSMKTIEFRKIFNK